MQNKNRGKCPFFFYTRFISQAALTGVIREKIEGNNIINEAIIELEGEKEYYVMSKLILTYNINIDYEYKFLSERIIDYTRVYVKHTDNLRVIFIPIGAEDFQDITIPDQNISKVYTDLLLPEKGFRLIFVKS